MWIKKGAGYGPAGPDMNTKELQQRLRQLGFKVPMDGKYGNQTEMAVKAFQKQYGLDPHGGIDAATLELLRNPAGSEGGPTQNFQQATAAKSRRCREEDGVDEEGDLGQEEGRDGQRQEEGSRSDRLRRHRHTLCEGHCRHGRHHHEGQCHLEHDGHHQVARPPGPSCWAPRPPIARRRASSVRAATCSRAVA